MKKILVAFTTVFLLSACGSKIDGVYTDQTGIAEFKFKPDGTVQMMGTEMKYEVVGKEVKVAAPQGKLIFDIIDDDTLSSDLMGKLKKKKK